MRIITRILAGIGLLVVLSFSISVLTLIFAGPDTPPVAARTILTFDFKTELAENPDNNLIMTALGEETVALRHFIQALDVARKDPRIVGAYFNVSDMNLTGAQVEEARAAIKRFNDSGKQTFAWADTYGEIGPGNRAYWLAAAAQNVSIQPLGTVGLTGGAASLPFAREALNRLGVVPDLHSRYEYKGAADNITESSMPAPLRENYTRLLNDLNNTMVRDISADRKIEEAGLRKTMDIAPLSAQQALDAKLIDRVAYEDEIEAGLKEIAGAKGGFYNLINYLYQSPPPVEDPEAKVALVFINGAIIRRANGRGPMGESQTASAEEIAPAILAAANDKDLKAIIIRMDSPGGSVTASETIARTIKIARDKGKFVVVSMGSTAASGGYWISAGADKIVADASTLTGSIGVVGGKIVFGPLTEKLGVNWEELGTNANSTMWSTAKPFSGTGLDRVNAGLDEIYNGFAKRVGEGRNLTPEQVDKIARGRIWTGASAKEVGLVDELGGLREAMALVRQHLKLDENAVLQVHNYPEPEPTIKRVISILRQLIMLPTQLTLSWDNFKAALGGDLGTHAAYYGGPRGLD